jgi:hypothetical protein
MAGFGTLAAAVIILVVPAQDARAQNPALSPEPVACREASMMARQASHLVSSLTDLGLSGAQAVQYLKAFQQQTDGCGIDPNHAVAPAPAFPALERRRGSPLGPPATTGTRDGVLGSGLSLVATL